MITRSNAFAMLCAVLLGSPFAMLGQASVSRTHAARPVDTTVTVLVESPQKFIGRRVHIFASFHSDGIHFTLLKEPNCGLFDGTSKTPPPNQPQCSRGIVPIDPAKTIDNPGDQALDQALAKGWRGTEDKHITAEFTGIFRRVRSASRKYFGLEIERTENVKVKMKDMNPHRPTS